MQGASESHQPRTGTFSRTRLYFLYQNDRNESDDVDEELAQKDAKELLEASSFNYLSYRFNRRCYFFLSLNSFLPKECLSKLGIAVLGRRRQMGHRRRRLHQNYRKSKSETASSDIRRIREGTWNNGSRIRIFRK